MHNATDKKLKLGKGAAFVKSRLRYLPQTADVWEAGFGVLPNRSRIGSGWLGVVVSVTDDFLLADRIAESPPSVNDLATLLAVAMRRPLVDGAHRPRVVRLHSLPEWNELIPHLQELGIEVVTQDTLARCEKEIAMFIREVVDQE